MAAIRAVATARRVTAISSDFTGVILAACQMTGSSVQRPKTDASASTISPAVA